MSNLCREQDRLEGDGLLAAIDRLSIYDGNLARQIALLLLRAGTLRVAHTYSQRSGPDDLTSVMVNEKSIMCEPPLFVYPKTKSGVGSRPLLYACLDRVQFRFSGGAGDSYAQVSGDRFHEQGILLDERAGRLLADIVMHFNGLADAARKGFPLNYFES